MSKKMEKFVVVVNADGRWYGEAKADTPEEAYNKVLENIKIDEPNTTVTSTFCEHCEIYYDDNNSDYIYPDDKEFTEHNPQNYDVSIIIHLAYKAEIEAENLELARKKVLDIWADIEYPTDLDICDFEIDGE